MVDCDFCGKTITPGTGKLYVKKDGVVFRFCSSKCEKNQVDKKYKARKTPWTNLFRSLQKGKK